MEALKDCGIPVEQASPWQPGTPVKESRAYLDILTAKTQGEYQYLGCSATGEECYGVRLTVEFRLRLLTPKSFGGEGAEAFGEKVLDGLLSALGALALSEISLGQTEYDGLRDCFLQTVQAQTRVFAWGSAEESYPLLSQFRVDAALS